MKPMLVVNWCGHAQNCVAWPEADGYWTLPAGEPLSQT